MRHSYQTLIGVMSQVLQYGSSLLILPLILLAFSDEELGVWYILVSLQAFIFLLDMGLNPSFARVVSQAYAGASSILPQGLSASDCDVPNYKLIKSLVALMIYIYALIGILSFFISFLGGWLYFDSVQLIEHTREGVRVICLVTAIGLLLQLGTQWINSWFIGAGLAHLNQLSIVISRCLFLLFGFLSISLDQGVLGLVVSNSLGVVGGVIFKLMVFAKTFDASLKRQDLVLNAELLRTIWSNSWRLGVVGLSTFIVLRYGILLIGYFESVEQAGALGVLVQVSTALIAAAMIPWQVGLKTLVSLKMSGSLPELRHFTLALWAKSLGLYACGLVAISIVAQYNFFDKTILHGIVFSWLFVLYFTFSFLELNHTAATFFIAAGNSVPFLLAAVASATLSLIMSSTLVALGFGLTGIILAQGIVQLAWNNWFWPRKVYLELRYGE